MSKFPTALTAPPAPDLDWSRDGTPASTTYDDIYFSVDGGLEETKAVFLQGCGLPLRWKDQDVFTIGELGFGSGLNFLAAWDLWRKTAREHQQLHFISVEGFPWSAEDLRRALGAWPELADCTESLTAQWPGQVKGPHRLHFGNVTLTLLHDDCETALSGLDTGVDAWFLDGFSPSKNPNMWTQSIFNHMARLSNAGAVVGTFTVAGLVRRGLASAGFTVSKKPGFGRKRERLEAIYETSVRAGRARLNHPPIIIGCGIAGASIARGFLRRGITPVIIEPETDLQSAASGNPAGLVMPRMDLQDRPESRFFLSAYLYALQAYQDSGAVTDEGIVQLAKSENEAARFAKLMAQSALPLHHMQSVDGARGQEICGLSVEVGFGGLYFPLAQTINPKEAVKKWTYGAPRIVKSASKIKYDTVWTVYDDKGEALAVSEHVFVTAGANVLDLLDVDVRFTRGQICWGDTDNPPQSALTYGGYCAPYGGGVLLGATHEHVGAGQAAQTRLEDTQENLDMFAALCGQILPAEHMHSRAAIRVTTKDTLPIAAERGAGLYVLSGLGARGMMMSPLLGESLVCQALGEPTPVCEHTKMRFGTRENLDPKRT